MNPFRSPTAEEAPVDASVLSVSSPRGPAIIFAFLAWVLAFAWSGTMLWDLGPYTWWSLGVPLVFLVAILATICTASNREVLALGSDEMTVFSPYPLDASCVTLQKNEIESIEWGIGYEFDTVTIKLLETADGAAYRSNAWSKASPATREVCWQVDHDAAMNCERSHIREALQQWLSDAPNSAEPRQLTVARIT